MWNEVLVYKNHTMTLVCAMRHAKVKPVVFKGNGFLNITHIRVAQNTAQFPLLLAAAASKP
jgi:hypothetical protein